MAHPYLWHTFGVPRCTPSAMYMAHPYYVPGTPILWHNLHTVQTPRSDAPSRRPVQTPRSDAPARTAPHINMALGRGCSLQSGVGESPTL